MKKETLYRYFEGIASREEEEAIYRCRRSYRSR